MTSLEINVLHMLLSDYNYGLLLWFRDKKSVLRLTALGSKLAYSSGNLI